jgi:CubicO group peptidase (beta-lactamase class C family)
VKNAELSPLLDGLAATRIVDGGVAPGGVLACGARRGDGFRFAHGAAGIRSALRPDPIDVRTPYDLASVTKSFVACAAARLAKKGVVHLHMPLGAVVPEVKGTASAEAPLDLLLSHRAGLDAHLPLYAPLLEGRVLDPTEALRLSANARRLDCTGPYPDGGFPPLYSDLCFYLAGVLLSRAAGASLEEIVKREVCEPLGLDAGSAEQWRQRDAGFESRVAPTEVVPFRGGEIVGEVHDENAWALVGRGLAGHAGLFGTALTVARFGGAMIECLRGHRPDFLGPEEFLPLVRPRPGSTLRAGFDGRSPEGSSAGRAFGPHSFGHLGFTGTSLWCDPDAGAVAVILTNRVSPSRDNVAIRAERPLLNGELFKATERLFPPHP